MREESMAGGMVFRKDCDGCGRSFFTPDRKAKLCPRCAEGAQKRDQLRKDKKEKGPAIAIASPKGSIETELPLAPTGDIKVQIPEGGIEAPGAEGHKERTGKPEVEKMAGVQTAGMEKTEMILTEEQEQEVIKRYQEYVEGMKRPPHGRRKTIAADMGLPRHAVVLAVRKWNQGQPQAEHLSREERFLMEKSYFSLLESENSLSRIKEQMTREAGLTHWQVCRYLDVLHDGEDQLREVPDVSPEQRTAILSEYQAYLSAPVPPGPPLHTLIAERTGVSPKQVHKILLAYRLARLREKGL
jgi:hypothetical protein